MVTVFASMRRRVRLTLHELYMLHFRWARHFVTLIVVGLHLIECNSRHREYKVKFSRSREKMGKFIPQMTPVWDKIGRRPKLSPLRHSPRRFFFKFLNRMCINAYTINVMSNKTPCFLINFFHVRVVLSSAETITTSVEQTGRT